MTVRLYQSTDASAPTITGTAGSLIGVLDAVLVNGYGTQTAAGWAKAQTGTNLAAYRAATGNRMFLRVDDTGTQEARMVSYETMSDVNTGTNPSPTAAQLTGGIYLRKSNTADATVRPWVMVASATAFYLFIMPLQTTSTTWLTTGTTDSCGHMFFGDLISYVNGTDNFATMLIGMAATGGGSIGKLSTKVANSGQGTTITSVAGHFVQRAYTQTVGAIVVSKQVPGDYGDGTTTGFTSSLTLPTYPDVCSGSILLSNVEIIEQGSSCYLIRGKMPGGFAPVAQLPGQHGDIVIGTGAYAGRSWLIVATANATVMGRFAVELTNNW